MKLAESNVHIEKSESIQEMFFGIDDDKLGVVFDVLRSKIYSNPLASICREISTNARDANIEAGLKDTPIKIEIKKQTLNNNSTTTFEVSDNGIGISPDRMETVFCKYGSTTKDNNNDESGGFGLGAKTPFSYTDLFSIVTVYDKIKYSYIAYVDESKKGKIVLQNKTETEKDTGTTIIVPIKNEDQDKFEEFSIFYTNMWRVKPQYIGFSKKVDEIKHVKLEINNNDKYTIVKSDIYKNDSQIHVLIDGIPYVIDKPHFKETLVDNNQKLGATLFLNIGIGDIDISANREKLQYTDKTVRVLKEKIENLKLEFEKDIKEFVNIKCTYLESCVKYYSIITPISYDSYAQNNTTFDQYIKDQSLDFIKANKFLSIKSIDLNYYRYIHNFLKNNSLYDFKIILDDGNVLYSNLSFSTLKLEKIYLQLNTENILKTLYYNLDIIHFYKDAVYIQDMSKRNVRKDMHILKNNKKNIILISRKKYRRRSWDTDIIAEKAQKDYLIKQQKELDILEKIMGGPLEKYSNIPLIKLENNKADNSDVTRRISVRVLKSSIDLLSSCDTKTVTGTVTIENKNYILDALAGREKLNMSDTIILYVKKLKDIEDSKNLYKEDLIIINIYRNIKKNRRILIVKDSDKKYFKESSYIEYSKDMLKNINKHLIITLFDYLECLDVSDFIKNRGISKITYADEFINESIKYFQSKTLKYRRDKELEYIIQNIAYSNRVIYISTLRYLKIDQISDTVKYREKIRMLPELYLLMKYLDSYNEWDKSVLKKDIEEHINLYIDAINKNKKII